MKADYLFHADAIEGSVDEPLFGVALNDKVGHCGLSYEVVDKNNAKIIHLGFHNKLLYQSAFDDLHWWVRPSMHSFQLEALAPLCEVIHRKHQNGDLFLAYGLRYDEYATIQMDGKLEYGRNGTGLTCATFILTIFHSCGIDLIDLENWNPRSDDDSFFNYIKSIFADLRCRNKYQISEEHANSQLGDIGMKRFRPEEVAVSTALYDGGAAPSERIQSEAAAVKEYILQQSGKRPK